MIDVGHSNLNSMLLTMDSITAWYSDWHLEHGFVICLAVITPIFVASGLTAFP